MNAAPVLITGGAGFVGSNLADRLASEGRPVRILDALSRAGVEENLGWLLARHGALIEFQRADIRDRAAVAAAVEGVSAIYHLAAQVAVTSSIAAPEEDFGVNAQGTLLLLEAVRRLSPMPPLIFTSTNKVYGALGWLALESDGRRTWPRDAAAQGGVDESAPLEFYSPYGCSKGVADAYALDYARIFGAPTVVLRMSCIYGPRQFGTEDQGWLAHFVLQALSGKPITLYGDGAQVRDVLFVDDLVDALAMAPGHIEALQGKAFNIGGGPQRAVSLVEAIDLIERQTGHRIDLRHGPVRPGDQAFYVSDYSAFTAATGWRPRIGVEEGLERLTAWLEPRNAKLEMRA